VVSTPSLLDLSPLGVLGFSSHQERLYRLVLRHSGSTLATIAGLAGLPVGEVREQLTRFAGVGVLELRAQRGDVEVVARPPYEALGRLINEETLRVQVRGEQLDAVRDLLPSLQADHFAATAPTGKPVPVERVVGGDVAQLLKALSAASTGPLRWLRSDPWNVPTSPEIDSWIGDLVRSGRRSWVIYPTEALHRVPEMVRSRSAAGEQVRVLASVPTRLAVLGASSALLPESPGQLDDHRLVVRQPALVQALTTLFDQLWDRALPVPGFGGSPSQSENDHRLLLQQLVGGAKDEQIARALGLSVRTVRRRIAELLSELGAESRFHAGVEAVRRGWL
jgi:hypothetical protein